MEFIKATGLGNDFVMIVDQNVDENSLSYMTQRLADRRYGIGCDQVIIAQKQLDKLFNVRFFNPDGSEAESCGNGTRCIAKHLMRLYGATTIHLQTLGGQLECHQDNDQVRVKMPSPKIESIEDVSSLGHLSTPDALAVIVGNPHLVCFVDDINLVSTYGQGLENHPSFPLRVNVDFANIIDRSTIQLKVWERGTGITPACGSGACATAVAAIHHGLVEEKVNVQQVGGALTIEWNKQELWMTGTATIVFQGHIDL